MKWLKRLFHRHKWENFSDNILGENNVRFTIGIGQCRECGKSKIHYTYGSKRR